MITLTPQQETDLMDAARAELVQALILKSDGVKLLSLSQAAGLLDIHPNTIATLPIHRVVITPKVIKYRLSDIEAFIESRIERTIPAKPLR